jgi:hypothetical protein
LSPSYQRDPLCDNIIVIIAVIFYKNNSAFLVCTFCADIKMNTKYGDPIKNPHNMGEPSIAGIFVKIIKIQ